MLSMHPQASIRVDVDFFDLDEKQKLLHYPTADQIQAAVANGVTVPLAELLTYYLFHRKRTGLPGYANYKAIAEKIDIARRQLDGCVNFNGKSLCSPPGLKHQLTEITEHIGEAVGLAVISQIHGLTEADWSPIEERRGRGALPSFDFELASDGKRLVEVENKGSFVADNQAITPSVREHKRKIDTKKTKLVVPVHGVRYGTIAAVDSRQDGHVKCLLTDPDPEQVSSDPRLFRLLQRERFLRKWLSILKPRSQLTSALSTRVASLESMKNPFELDGVQLYRTHNLPFEFLSFFGGSRGGLFSQARVFGEATGGIIVRSSRDYLTFLGMKEELLEIAAQQSFQRILDVRYVPHAAIQTIECRLSRQQFNALSLPDITDIRRRATYVEFSVKTHVHHSSSGLSFGFAEIRPERTRAEAT